MTLRVLSKSESKKTFRRSFSGANGEDFNLETYLWESANILRGHVDASDFKSYIFPLLFYKRISDVYDEEYKKALDDSDGDEEYASSDVNHRFQIPSGYHWNDLRSKSKNIGIFLQKSFREIEKTNPSTLYGIFGDTNWGNKEKISDETLINLVEHFSQISLVNSKIEPDILGNAYEYLIKRFADLTNKKAGEFYTPRSIVKLLTHFIDPKNNETIYDPACGTAGMLLEAIDSIKKEKKDFRTVKLFGQESNLTTAAIARINLFLHGLDDFKIIRGDTLRSPAFIEDNKLSTFDCVIANPPFSLEEWGYDVWQNDPFDRVIFGLPPKQFGDFAWIQHMISSMKKNTGRAGVVIASGALYRPTEKSIRKKLIERDLLVAIIQLSQNLFYGTNISPCILVFRNLKKKIEKDNVLMIDATSLFESGRAQNYLRDTHIEKILDIFVHRKEVKHISKIVTRGEITDKDYDLSLSKYIAPEYSENIISDSKIFSDFKQTKEDFKKSNSKLQKILVEMGMTYE
jgi:type I restriction enzyme M protein